MTRARSITIVRQPDGPLAGALPVGLAVDQLRAALLAREIDARVVERASLADSNAFTVLVTGLDAPEAALLLARTGVPVPHVPEAFALVTGPADAGPHLLACGADARGLAYAVLELADRVTHAEDPFASLVLDAPVVQQPANKVRSVARLFSSEDDDKPWFHDEGFWRRYLSMLVAQRFNRFSLTLGLGYNFPWHVTDAYLYFAYPFLVDVPGYRVRVAQLPDEERSRNLEMLRFISRESVDRGLDFQLGLWTHAYEWLESPNARHTIEGLTPERLAPYCRDALEVLLDACPGISGLTLRTHGESGIPERRWDFWRLVFEGAMRAGRQVGLDLHAKGLDWETLELARATGLPLTVSPKYAAEHMGLPYHQAAIRDLDRPVPIGPAPTSRKDRYMAVSEGDRSFTRYSYGDFLREDRDYDVVFRIWPGTQRLLLWGDPAMAAGFGRHSAISGSQGLEWCEPLAFRGREGSAVPGSRDGYADATLSSSDDWRKYDYTYRLMGRLTYDPHEEADAWGRHLRASFGAASGPAERALANASRILPLVTTAHHPSASNNYYWPELYTDMPVVPEGSSAAHYYDTPIPKRFGTVSPLDPEVFSSVDEFVDEVLAGARSGRYSPLDVARWLDRLSRAAADQLATFESEVPDGTAPGARRLGVDIGIQAALGRFFAGKLRAAVWHAAAVRTGHPLPLQDALAAYRDARAALAQAAHLATGVYARDLTFGPQPWLRGTWSDRLPAVDRDIDAMVALLHAWRRPAAGSEGAARLLLDEIARDAPAASISHRPPSSFQRGDAVGLSLEVGPADSTRVSGVSLRYRPLDQSARYEAVDMTRDGAVFTGSIPAGGTDSPYPLQYHFVIRGGEGDAWLYPGLDADLSNQPYVVIRNDAAIGRDLQTRPVRRGHG